MSLRIVLDGQTVDPKDVQGENGVTINITVEEEDGNTMVKKASGELEFFGAAYETIKAQLIDPPDGKMREVPVEFFEDCTTPFLSVFKGVIRGDTVSFCDDECSVKCNAIEKTEDTLAMDCLKSTMIWDNHIGFQSQAHPRMIYCDELRPDWLHHVILIHGIMLLIAILTLTPIVAIFSVLISLINGIIDAINAIPGIDIDHIDFDGDDSTTLLEEWQTMKGELILKIIGCGRAHPSPLLRSYIGNVCNKCGLTFQSSILNDPASDYYNTVLFSAPVEKGTFDEATTFIYPNRHIATLDTLMKDVKPVFHGSTRVLNGVFHFEREDRMPGGGMWIDPAVLKSQGRLVGNVCYKWRSEAPVALAQIGFAEDAVDSVGNEARDLYREIIEWNQPFNAVQKGELTEQFRFGMLRCRRDGVGGDILDSYAWWPDFTGPINNFGHVMMLERGMAAFPKLLVWDGNTGFGQVRRFDIPGYVKTFAENYNYPYHVTEFGTTPNTGYEPDEPGLAIYGRFHAYRNPKVLGDRGLEWNFTWEKYTANELISMNPLADVPLSQGTGKITSITINLSARTILVAGKV